MFVVKLLATILKQEFIMANHYKLLTKVIIILSSFLTGWDISSKNLADAMWDACVLDFNLQEQLRPHMEKLKPRPSIYCPDFIAANQADRADNLLQGKDGICLWIQHSIK